MTSLRATLMAGVVAAGATLALAGAPMPAAADDEPRYGGTITVGYVSRLNMLDPYATVEHTARMVYNHIYEALMSRTEDNEPAPDLAESYEVNEDNTLFTFRLREGIAFHDGTPLTSADVRASYERAARIHIDRHIFEMVKEIRTPDDLTIEIELIEPVPVFLRQISSPRAAFSIIPAADADAEPNRLSWIGTGPYKMQEWVQGSHIHLVRNEDYTPNEAYEGTDGLVGRKIPYLDEIVMRRVEEDQARVAGLETGELDMIETISSRAALRLRERPEFTLYELLPWEIYSLYVNHVKPPTDDVRIRRAMQIGLRMEEIMSLGTDDNFDLSHGWQYPHQGYYAHDAGRDIYDRGDIEGARALLEEAGYDGEEVILLTQSRSDLVNASIATMAQLREVGFNAKIEVYDLATATAKRSDPDAWHLWFNPMGTATWVGPDFVIPRFMGDNPIQFEPKPEIDELFQDMMTKPTDDERKAAFAAIQQFMADDVTSIKLGDAGKFQASRHHVKGYKPFRVIRLWNVWIDPDAAG